MWDNRGRAGDAFGDAGSDQRDFLLRALTEAPNIAARIIATAADDPLAIDVIHILPLAVQLRALQETWRLTMEDIGGPQQLAALTAMMSR